MEGKRAMPPVYLPYRDVKFAFFIVDQKKIKIKRKIGEEGKEKGDLRPDIHPWLGSKNE